MKVILINPPTPKKEIWVREGRCQQFDIWGAPFPPLSLAYIAGQIKNIAEPLIIDSGPAKLDLKATLKIIKEFSPQLIIISTATPTIDTDLNWFAKEVKDENPNIKIAAIGIHVTTFPKETLRDFNCLDFVICGEPEITTKELIETLIAKGDLTEVLGIAFRQNGKILTNPKREFIEDLDNLAFPYWPGVNFSNYKIPIINKSFNLISFARGCPFNCKFCNAHVYYGKRIRKRSPEKIIEEIQTNIENGIKDFLFWTEFVTADREYLLKVLNLIKSKGLGKKIRWISNSRADIIDFDLFKTMREAGCWQLAFGLEFGNNRILQLAQKGPNATVERGRKAVENAAEAGIVVDGHFILGYPGETEDTLCDTINYALSLPLTFAHFYVATPFPGSELYQEAVQKKWLIDSNWRKISQEIPNLNTPWLSPSIIKKYIGLAYRKFYWRPVTFWRIAKIAKNPSEFLNIIKLGVKFSRDLFKI